LGNEFLFSEICHETRHSQNNNYFVILIFMLNNSVTSPKFYGVAASFGEHGLNVCVANTESKNLNNIVKNDRLSWLHSDRTSLLTAVAKLVNTVTDVAKLQAQENKVNHTSYTLPIVIGWPGKDKLPELKVLDREYSRNPALDSVCDFIENTIADNLRQVIPGLPFDMRTGNYSRASEELRKQAASTECPFPNLEIIANKAASGDEKAQKQMQEWNQEIAKQVFLQAKARLGNQLHTLNFMNMTTPPWLGFFNTPELKADLERQVAINIGFPGKRIDIKFPEDPNGDQYFNVLRPLMKTNIEALTVPMT
jgi:hypothetical protein